MECKILPIQIIIPYVSLTTANLMTNRTALLNALAKQSEDITGIQAELKRKRKETAKARLRKLTLTKTIHDGEYHICATAIGYAN